MRGVRFGAGVVAFSIWIGLPFYILGVGMQAVHVTTALLAVIFIAHNIISGDLRIMTIAPVVNKWYVSVCGAVILILTVGLISGIYAAELADVFRFEASFLLGIIIMTLWAGIFTAKSDVDILLKWLAGGAVFSCLALAAGLLIPQIGVITFNKYGRAQGFLLHPNQLGMLLAALLPWVCGRLAVDFRRIGYWAAVLLLAGGIVMSGSKTNILIGGTLGPLMLFWVSLIKRDARKRFISIMAAGITLTFIAGTAFLLLQDLAPQTLTNLSLVLSDPDRYRSFQERQHMWTTAALVVRNSPFFGIGAGNTQIYLQQNHAHNVFVEFWLTMGFCGLAALILFLISLSLLCFFSLRAAAAMPLVERADVTGLSLGILSYVLSNQMSDSFGGTTLPMLWVLTGTLLARVNTLLLDRTD